MLVAAAETLSSFFFGFSASDNELDVPQGYVSNSAPVGPHLDPQRPDLQQPRGRRPASAQWDEGVVLSEPERRFVIGEVPEPSTWAMMLLGVAGSGLGWMAATARSRVQRLVYGAHGDQAAFGIAS